MANKMGFGQAGHGNEEVHYAQDRQMGSDKGKTCIKQPKHPKQLGWLCLLSVS